jgi:hypothetical protein
VALELLDLSKNLLTRDGIKLFLCPFLEDINLTSTL